MIHVNQIMGWQAEGVRLFSGNWQHLRYLYSKFQCKLTNVSTVVLPLSVEIVLSHFIFFIFHAWESHYFIFKLVKPEEKKNLPETCHVN